MPKKANIVDRPVVNCEAAPAKGIVVGTLPADPEGAAASIRGEPGIYSDIQISRAPRQQVDREASTGGRKATHREWRLCHTRGSSIGS